MHQTFLENTSLLSYNTLSHKIEQFTDITSIRLTTNDHDDTVQWFNTYGIDQ